jgi:hypothetical protein
MQLTKTVKITEINRTKEELYFLYWLQELEQIGIVTNIIEQPESMILTKSIDVDVLKKLKTKSITTKRTLLRPWTYGADYVFEINENHIRKYRDVFQIISDLELPMPIFLTSIPNTFYVDVKPEYRNPRQAMSDNKFPINQKMMWDKHSIYVNKIIPNKLFEKTFTPKNVILNEIYQKDTKHGRTGESKLKHTVRTLTEFVSIT